MQVPFPFQRPCWYYKLCKPMMNCSLFIPCYYVHTLLCPMVQVGYTTRFQSLRYTQPRACGPWLCISHRGLHLVVYPIHVQYIPLSPHTHSFPTHPLSHSHIVSPPTLHQGDDGWDYMFSDNFVGLEQLLASNKQPAPSTDQAPNISRGRNYTYRDAFDHLVLLDQI